MIMYNYEYSSGLEDINLNQLIQTARAVVLRRCV
jgi:hypothetical protein